MLACGSSEPDSPLILGRDAKEVAPGPRQLSSAQNRALQSAVTSTGAPCVGLDRTYLRSLGAEGQSETWDVRCLEGSYSVQIFADGTAADVQRCFGWSEEGCADPYSRRRFRQEPERREPLNPDLGKLLEPMTSTNGKVD